MSLSVPSKTSASPEHSTISTDTLHYNDARHGKAIALVAVLRNKKKGGNLRKYTCGASEHSHAYDKCVLLV